MVTIIGTGTSTAYMYLSTSGGTRTVAARARIVRRPASSNSSMLNLNYYEVYTRQVGVFFLKKKQINKGASLHASLITIAYKHIHIFKNFLLGKTGKTPLS
eukprot:SAG31_NODE_786_length_12098_cov_15.117446_13_plen_101_part_00